MVVEEDEEGGYVVYVPVLPGCHSQGDTLDEALANIKEAIELYLDVLDPDEKEAALYAISHVRGMKRVEVNA